jgi:hypothetical protein
MGIKSMFFVTNITVSSAFTFYLCPPVRWPSSRGASLWLLIYIHLRHLFFAIERSLVPFSIILFFMSTLDKPWTHRHLAIVVLQYSLTNYDHFETYFFWEYMADICDPANLVLLWEYCKRLPTTIDVRDTDRLAIDPAHLNCLIVK